MRKVDGLSLIFIDFYVPALTPRLNSTETSLQLSENRIHKVKFKVILRLKVSKSVNLGVDPHLSLMTRYLLLFDSYGLVFWVGGARSVERMGLTFVYTADPDQRSLS
jgi:hypothetical protein